MPSASQGSCPLATWQAAILALPDSERGWLMGKLQNPPPNRPQMCGAVYTCPSQPWPLSFKRQVGGALNECRRVIADFRAHPEAKWLSWFYKQITVLCSPSVPADSHSGGSLPDPMAPFTENSPCLPRASSLNLRGLVP